MIKRLLVTVLACALVPGCGVLKKRTTVDAVQVQRNTTERVETIDRRVVTDRARDVDAVELTIRLDPQAAAGLNVSDDQLPARDLNAAIAGAIQQAKEITLRSERLREELKRDETTNNNTAETTHSTDSTAVKADNTYNRTPSIWTSVWTWAIIAVAAAIIYFAWRRILRTILPW